MDKKPYKKALYINTLKHANKHNILIINNIQKYAFL